MTLIASHRVASHRIASHRIAWHRIASHRIASQALTPRCAAPPYAYPLPSRPPAVRGTLCVCSFMRQTVNGEESLMDLDENIGKGLTIVIVPTHRLRSAIQVTLPIGWGWPTLTLVRRHKQHLRDVKQLKRLLQERCTHTAPAPCVPPLPSLILFFRHALVFPADHYVGQQTGWTKSICA
jgi:hypothetical protein